MSRSSLVRCIAAVAFGLLAPAAAEAAPEPVPVIELATGTNLYDATPEVSPDGDQIVTYMSQGAEKLLHFTERGNRGGEFGTPVQLSDTGNFEEPSISFTPDGGLYAIWGIASSGAIAEQAYRPPGGDFTAAQPAVGCGRFVDSAAGPGGEIAVACSHKLATNPPDTIRFGTSPTLGPVTVNEDLVPPAYDHFLSPRIEWGDEGTIAIVSDGYDTTTDPPPANQTKRIRVTLKNTSLAFAADVAFSTWPNEVSAGRPVVLDDGTVAVGLAGSSGARVIVRPPGQTTVFAPFPLPGDGIWGVGADSGQNIHALSGSADARQYSAQVRPPGGDFGPSFSIPLPVIAGGGDAYVSGFEVAPDGTEYALIRGDDGVYATSRAPGQAFLPPIKLGDDSISNPASALTPEGDLLVAWAHQEGVDDYTVEVGGLDKTSPEVTVSSFPERAEEGTPVSFSATATDAFGIAATGWDFDGTKVAGDDATHTFTSPGRHEVSFTATDVAGHETAVRKTVTVPGGSDGPGAETAMKLKAPKKVRFRVLRKRGIRVVVRAQPKMRVKAVLGTARKNARIRPLVTKVVSKLKNRHVIRLKPRRKRLGKPRKFRLRVRVTGTTAAGERITRSRVVRVRR